MELSPMEELRFYVDAKEHSCVYRFTFACAEPIEEEVLAEAVKQAMYFFPKYPTRPFIRKDGKGVVLLENHMPVPVFRDDAPRSLGTDETNGYLFRVTCRDRLLSISFFHALGDGKVTFRFALHVLYFYMRQKGYAVEPGPFILSEEDLKKTDLLRPLDDYFGETAQTDGQEKAPPFQEEQVFCLEKDFALFPEPGFHATTLSAPALELKRTIHAYGTTPLCLIVALLAQAVRRVFQAEGKVICFTAGVELRSRLQSCSQREFSTYANLYCLPEWDELPLSELCASIRREIEDELTIPEVWKKVRETAETDSLFKQYFDLRQPDQIREVLRKKEKPVRTCAYLSSTGVIRMPDGMTDFVNGLSVRCTPSSKEPNLFLYTFGDRFYIQFSTNDTDGQLEQAFCRILGEHGINCRLEDSGIVQLDYLGNPAVEP